MQAFTHLVLCNLLNSNSFALELDCLDPGIVLREGVSNMRSAGF